MRIRIFPFFVKLAVAEISRARGGLSHVFLDSMTHEFNPVFYPVVKESFDAFMLTDDLTLATAIVTCVLLKLLILLS